MVALSDVPINSLTWMTGAMSSLLLGYRSFAHYRTSRNELSKYLGWFGVLVGTGLAVMAIPSFFTLDTETLRRTYLVGEFFIYSCAVAQIAVVWCLMLRSYVPIYFVTVPVAVINLVSWLYSLPRSTLHIVDNFIVYRDPPASTIVVGVLLFCLFIPVGLYFLYSAAKQPKPKARLTSLVFGLVYAGIGFFTGGVELVAGEVITPKTAVIDLVFFAGMLAIMLWPRRSAAAQKTA